MTLGIRLWKGTQAINEMKTRTAIKDSTEKIKKYLEEGRFEALERCQEIFIKPEKKGYSSLIGLLSAYKALVEGDLPKAGFFVLVLTEHEESGELYELCKEWGHRLSVIINAGMALEGPAKGVDHKFHLEELKEVMDTLPKTNCRKLKDTIGLLKDRYSDLQDMVRFKNLLQELDSTEAQMDNISKLDEI